MNENNEILALWVGPQSQKTAHHFYALQVIRLTTRQSSSLKKMKTPPISAHSGTSRTKKWIKNTPEWSSLIAKAITSPESGKSITKNYSKRWTSTQKTKGSSPSSICLPAKRKKSRNRMTPTSGFIKTGVGARKTTLLLIDSTMN